MLAKNSLKFTQSNSFITVILLKSKDQNEEDGEKERGMMRERDKKKRMTAF